jgi:hypothetical protein
MATEDTVKLLIELPTPSTSETGLPMKATEHRWRQRQTTRIRPGAAHTVGLSTRYPPGLEPSSWTPGDFLVVHSESWHNKVVQWAQRQAAHGEERRFAYWDHTALVVSDDGEIVESISSQGVTRSRAVQYLFSDYHVVHIEATDEVRRLVVEYADWTIDQGTRYGWWSVVGIACMIVSRGRFTFEIPGQEICSGIVARAMERAGALFRTTPSHVTPADLARFYGVEPPVVDGRRCRRPGFDRRPAPSSTTLAAAL